MTDKDIIKALECCTTNGASCKDCPAFVKVERSNCKKYFRGALALINRQQAEIERLKAKCENTQIGYNFAEDEIKNLKKDKYKLQKALNQSEDYRVIAKAEAVKEFAERLKNKIKIECNPYGKPTFDYDTSISIMRYIDNLVKEMVGGEK